MKKTFFGKKAGAVLALAIVALSAFSLAACAPKAAEIPLTRYTIAARYDDEAHSLSAQMNVRYVNRTESVLDEVCFHLYPAAFRSGARFSPVPDDMAAQAYPDGISYGGIAITSLAVDGTAQAAEIGGQDEDILVVSLPGELYPGDTASIDLGFTLTVPAARLRLGVTEGRVNLGNWYPIACVYENGNFVTDPYYSNGDPFYSECADYSVALDVADRYNVAMSGKTRVTAGEAGRKVFSAELRSARDFAAVIGEFKMLGTAVNGADVNYYYTIDPAPEKSLMAAADAIRTFGELFGAYPYESYSAVETGFVHGGMEYPALTMISDAAAGDLYTEVIVHETAHQWWYAAVGNDEVSYPWLDEGLTEFVTGMFYERNPGYHIDNAKRLSDALAAYVLYNDTFKKGGDTTMTRRLPDYATSLEYSQMTYVKGELMFEALRNLIGGEKFCAALRDYYARYKFAVARPDDLVGCFERASGRKLESFFSAWLDGKVAMYGGLAA